MVSGVHFKFLGYILFRAGSRVRLPISHTITSSFTRLLFKGQRKRVLKTNQPDSTEQSAKPGKNNNRVQEVVRRFISRHLKPNGVQLVSKLE